MEGACQGVLAWATPAKSRSARMRRRSGGTKRASLQARRNTAGAFSVGKSGDEASEEDRGSSNAQGRGIGNLKERWERFKQVGGPFWTRPEVRREAWMRAGVVVLLSLATTGVSVGFNFLGRDFISSISEKNVPKFWQYLGYYTAGIALATPLFVLRDFYSSKLQLRWRQFMTSEFLGEYFEDRAFYRLHRGGQVDNPDQRVNDDIAQFCDMSMGLAQDVFNSVIDLVSFSGIMLSIYPPLFFALMLYAAGGTFLATKIGRPLASLKFQQERTEADFRYSLVRVRENAESVAFYGGERRERQVIEARFDRAVQNLLGIITATRNLGFFQASYRLLVQFVPAALVAPLYFRGSIEFGVITQTSSAFNHILGDVSIVVNQYETLASFAAVLDRLGQFQDSLRSPSKPADAQTPEVIIDPSASSYPLSVRALSLTTPPPESNQLISKLDWDVALGEAWLVMGSSGSGKTTLLRALAGLWEHGSGSITLAAESSGVMFLPQRPYLILGSLRDQLLYPVFKSLRSSANSTGDGKEHEPQGRPDPPDEAIVDALKAVRLDSLASKERLDEETDWSFQLSLGEQQRLGFARVLLARPQLALFDEATSALDVPAERSIYSQLRELGTTIVSIGHRPTLVGFHDQVLKIGDGSLGWSHVPASRISPLDGSLVESSPGADEPQAL